VYAKCGANHFGYILSGGDKFNICGFDDFNKYGRHIFETKNVPRVFI
jgi:hypothetical protein